MNTKTYYISRLKKILKTFKINTKINNSDNGIRPNLLKRVCLITNRKKAIYKDLKVSRIIIRDLSPYISGIRKLSW